MNKQVVVQVSPDVKSRNGNLFYWSSYWHCWSRVLSVQGRLEIGTVEVDLTAINPTHAHAWERVRRINIRAHGTARGRGDQLVSALPGIWVDKMHEMLGDAALVERLLHEDFLPSIDWYKYRKVCNGGAALADILK